MPGPLRFRRHHGRNQAVHQPIMIRPAADAIQPPFKQPEFMVPELRAQILEQHDSSGFFLKDTSRKEFVGHTHEEIKILLTENLFSALPHGAPKSRRTPSVRLDLFLEEALHTRRVLRRAAVPEYTADFGRNG